MDTVTVTEQVPFFSARTDVPETLHTLFDAEEIAMVTLERDVVDMPEIGRAHV